MDQTRRQVLRATAKLLLLGAAATSAGPAGPAAGVEAFPPGYDPFGHWWA